MPSTKIKPKNISLLLIIILTLLSNITVVKAIPTTTYVADLASDSLYSAAGILATLLIIIGIFTGLAIIRNISEENHSTETRPTPLQSLFGYFILIVVIIIFAIIIARLGG